MAKVPFSKFQATINSGVSDAFFCNKAGEEIRYEVKHYLPFRDKISLVERVVNFSVDRSGFYNPLRVRFFMTLEVVYAYTNLSFTEKAKEDSFKLYDILVSTGIFGNVVNCIEDEWNEIQESVWATIDSIYKYRNSVAGILETISSDYKDLALDAEEIQKKLASGEGIEFLQSVMDKLG